jgi:hypothetical protein
MHQRINAHETSRRERREAGGAFQDGARGRRGTLAWVEIGRRQQCPARTHKAAQTRGRTHIGTPSQRSASSARCRGGQGMGDARGACWNEWGRHTGIQTSIHRGQFIGVIGAKRASTKCMHAGVPRQVRFGTDLLVGRRNSRRRRPSKKGADQNLATGLDVQQTKPRDIRGGGSHPGATEEEEVPGSS